METRLTRTPSYYGNLSLSLGKPPTFCLNSTRLKELCHRCPCGGWGGGGTWVNFRWVCAASLLEPLPHYSLFCGHIIDPILVTLRGKNNFRNPNLTTFFFMHLPYKAFQFGHPQMN